MRNKLKFSFPDGYDEKRLIRELTDHYAIKKEPSMFKSFAMYDTFDWRLFNKSLVLYESENKLFLRKLYKNAIIHDIEISSLPVFIWDFPDSELRTVGADHKNASIAKAC